MPSFEVALPLGAIGFYLFDSTMLLYGNELVFIRQRARWDVTGGLDLFLFGKRICMPAWLCPWALLWRVAWKENDTRDAEQCEWPPPDLVEALHPLRWICTMLLVMLWVLLPAASIVWGAGILLLALFAVFYATVMVALAIVYAHRKSLRLTGSAFWLLALDVFACPPFAVNLVRKISLRYGMDGNPLAMAHLYFEPPANQRLIAIVTARVDEFLAQEEEGSAAARKLAAFRAELQGKAA